MSIENKSEIASTILALLQRDDSGSSSDSDSSTEEFLFSVVTTLNRLSENLTQDYTTEQFISLYRIHPKLFVKLASKFENSEFFRRNPAQGGGRPPIPPEKQVLIFLWYAGQRKASCRTISEHFDISLDRSCQVLHRVVPFLGALSEESIVWQNEQQQKEASITYCQRSGIPNIIGSLDTFQVLVPSPKENAALYLNSKHSHSVQVQAICDHRLKFLDVFVGLPASVPPDEVLQNSFIYSKLPQLCKGKYLVGNSCYKTSHWCLVPYKDVELTSAQENFNACLDNVLLDAKETFLMLKERFPCLHHLRLRQLKTACEVIMGCCILHNLADASDMAMIPKNNDDEDSQLFANFHFESGFVPSATQVRDSLAQQLFEDAGNGYSGSGGDG